MTVLTKPDIVRDLRLGNIVISKDGVNLKPEDLRIGPNSIDLHLHPHMKVYSPEDRRVHAGDALILPQRVFDLDARAENPTADIFMTEDGFTLLPGVLYIARTVERTYTPQHVPKIGGRSSTGRLGINIHQTAGFGDVGFDGTWTLELSCVQPVRIYPNMRIAQLWLFTLSTQLLLADRYAGRYQGQVEPTASRGHKPDEDV